jgi:hypothetical protein
LASVKPMIFCWAEAIEPIKNKPAIKAYGLIVKF